MPDLKIKVGCSVDRNLAAAYQPVIEAANKAAAAIAAAGTKGGRAQATAAKAGTDAAVKGQKAVATAADQSAAAQAKAAEKAAAAESKAADRAARDKIRAIKQCEAAREKENNAILRDVARIEQAEARAAAARSRGNEKSMRAAAREDRQGSRNLQRYAGYAMSATRSAVGAGVGFAKTVAGGMGVDIDMGSLISKGVSVEKNATDLVNSGFMPGKGGANGQHQDPKTIIDEVRRVAMATGGQSGDAMEGLQAFVAKTGDLETGRAVLMDLAKLSKATGANMRDMTDAAGDVANALGDVPNKGEAIRSVMGAIAAQGKEGAVEIKDLATQMAKVGAAAGMFTGDRAQSIANMGGLVQMTRAKGGAASATQAATSVMSFMQSFSKGARLDKFDKYGVKVNAADGKVRNPRDIIVDALKATGGDNRKMGEMFADAGARRVTRGYESIYKEAGGGAAGIKRVEEAFNDLARSTLQQKDMEEALARAMSTSESKANIFNEQMGKVAMELQAGFLPALQALAPVLVGTAGKVANWIAELTGAKEKKDRSDEIGVEARAITAGGALRTILRTGRTIDGETEQAGKAKAELAKAVEAKRKQVAAEGDETGATGEVGTFGAVSKRFKDMSADELAAAAKGGDDNASSFQRDKQQLDRMTDTLQDLDRSLQDAMTRALEGSVITVRMADPLYAPTPSLSSPTSGVEPAPGAP